MINEELVKEMVKVKKRKEKMIVELGRIMSFEDAFSDMLCEFFHQKFKNSNEIINVFYTDGCIVIYQSVVGGFKKYYKEFTLKNLKEIANVDSVEEFFNKLKKYKCETK